MVIILELWIVVKLLVQHCMTAMIPTNRLVSMIMQVLKSLKRKKNVDLQDMLKAHSLSHKGKKDEMAERMAKHLLAHSNQVMAAGKDPPHSVDQHEQRSYQSQL